MYNEDVIFLNDGSVIIHNICQEQLCFHTFGVFLSMTHFVLLPVVYTHFYGILVCGEGAPTSIISL